MPEPLLTDLTDGVLTLTNNDAPINRMTLEYMDALEAAVADAATDPAVRAVVFTAVGEDNFSVGMDLKQLRLQDNSDRGGFEGILDQRRRVLHAIETMAKPSVATLFGYCLGGGLELPLACHFRLAASEGARIGLPLSENAVCLSWQNPSGSASPMGQSSRAIAPSSCPSDRSRVRNRAAFEASTAC